MRSVTDDRYEEAGAEFGSEGLWGMLTPLLAKLFADTQALLRQELELGRAELREEAFRIRSSLRAFAVSSILGLIAAALIAQMSVHLLHLAFPAIPLWGCFGLIGVAVAIIALVIFGGSKARYRSEKRPMSRTIKSLQESLSCLARSR